MAPTLMSTTSEELIDSLNNCHSSVVYVYMYANQPIFSSYFTIHVVLTFNNKKKNEKKNRKTKEINRVYLSEVFNELIP